MPFVISSIVMWGALALLCVTLGISIDPNKMGYFQWLLATAVFLAPGIAVVINSWVESLAINDFKADVDLQKGLLKESVETFKAQYLQKIQEAADQAAKTHAVDRINNALGELVTMHERYLSLYRGVEAMVRLAPEQTGYRWNGADRRWEKVDNA